MVNNQQQIGTYANVLLDDWFKRTFGDESRKRLTTLMLQLFIPDREIESIRLAPQEHINPFDGKKDIRVGVECTDKDGARFMVEMQVAPQYDFFERAIYNSTFGIQQQIPHGQKPYGFMPVYFIGILAFALHSEKQSKLLYRYRLREDESLETMSDNIQYLFIELPNGAKSEADANSLFERFCYSLLNMSKMDSVPKGWDEDEIISLLFNSANISTFTPQERTKYINDMTTQRDFENQLIYAASKGMERGIEKGIEKGIEQGIEQGIEMGIEKGILRTAKAMIAEGLSDEIVAKCTGLSAEEIRAIK